MNGSGSTTTTATPLYNGSDKFGENNNKYDSVPSENAQKQQYQQQTQQQQYQQHGFADGFSTSSGTTTQLRRTQSIISQNLRDQQYQLYCTGSSPPLQQLQPVQQHQYGDTAVAQLQQQTANNAYGPVEDGGLLYGTGGVGTGPSSIVARQAQQQQQTIAAASQLRQQQYTAAGIATANSLQTETNYSSPIGTGNAAAMQQQLFYNKRGDSGGALFNCQQQTYQQQQEVLYQPYQPEYGTYQQQQQQPPNQQPQHQQQQPLSYNQMQQQQQPNQQQPNQQQQYNQSQQQPQQQYQQPQNQQYQSSQLQQYQRFPNQDQHQQQTVGDNSHQYSIEQQLQQQNRVDINSGQNVSALTLGGVPVTSGGIKYDATAAELSSTAFRPLQQQQGQVSNYNKANVQMCVDFVGCISRTFMIIYRGR